MSTLTYITDVWFVVYFEYFETASYEIQTKSQIMGCKFVETESYELLLVELQVTSYEFNFETVSYWQKCECNFKTASYKNFLQLKMRDTRNDCKLYSKWKLSDWNCCC